MEAPSETGEEGKEGREGVGGVGTGAATAFASPTAVAQGATMQLSGDSDDSEDEDPGAEVEEEESDEEDGDGDGDDNGAGLYFEDKTGDGDQQGRMVMADDEEDEGENDEDDYEGDETDSDEENDSEDGSNWVDDPEDAMDSFDLDDSDGGGHEGGGRRRKGRAMNRGSSSKAFQESMADLIATEADTHTGEPDSDFVDPDYQVLFPAFLLSPSFASLFYLFAAHSSSCKFLLFLIACISRSFAFFSPYLAAFSSISLFCDLLRSHTST
jgi:hypothetical protein